MGDTFAVLSMTLFAITNVMIAYGFDGKSRSHGAFLSIIITAVVSGLVWTGIGVTRGFSTIRPAAVIWFALAGILTMLIGRVFLYASMQRLGAIRGSAIKRLNPFFSVLLGVLLLDEAVTGAMAIGMLLIFSSFGVLAIQSVKTAGTEAGDAASDGVASKLVRMGYVYGPVSAFAYASGYVLRKQGLIQMPDAAFGTLIGGLSGIVMFVVLALFIEPCRQELSRTFREFNPWLLAAGITGTLGQMCYFVALTHITVSKIALITSMEVFVTIFLSFLIFRGKTRLTLDVTLAALLGLAGTILVIGN